MLADDQRSAGVALLDQVVQAGGHFVHIPLHFGHDQHFSAGGDGGLHGDIAAVAAHHLHHVGTVMAAAGGADGAHGLHAHVYRGIIAQRSLGVAQVVVDGAGDAHAGNAQLAQVHSAGEAAVAADDDQRVNAQLAQVFCGLPPYFGLLEFHAAGSAQEGAALIGNIQHRFQIKGANIVLGILAQAQQAVIAALDAHELDAVHSGAAGDAHDGCVHSGAVAAAGQDTNLPDHIAQSPYRIKKV